MITSWRDPDGRNSWFSTNEDGIDVHWLLFLTQLYVLCATFIFFFRFAILSARKQHLYLLMLFLLPVHH